MGIHDGISKKGTGPGVGKDFTNANFVHVEPYSHFWTDIAMLQNWLIYAHHLSKEQIIDHLKIGLSNTIKNGYNIQKVK